MKSLLQRFRKYIILSIISCGILLILISLLYISQYLAILGVSIVFWGVILLSFSPTKHVPLSLLSVVSTAGTANIERTLFEMDLSTKGYYLPPKYLTNLESSLVFVPKDPSQAIPKPEEIVENRLFTLYNTGLLLTPPGSTLAMLFEKELGVSAMKRDLLYIQENLPRILIDNLQLVKDVSISVQNNIVTFKVLESLLQEVCKQTNTQPKMHKQIGCLLSSSIACILAKATGKVIIIQSEEELSKNGINIEYQIMDD